MSHTDDLLTSCSSVKHTEVRQTDDLLPSCSSVKHIEVSHTDNLLSSCSSAKHTEVSQTDDLLPSCSSIKYTEVSQTDDLLSSCSSIKHTEMSQTDDLLSSCLYVKHTQVSQTDDLLPSCSSVKHTEVSHTDDLVPSCSSAVVITRWMKQTYIHTYRHLLACLLVMSFNTFSIHLTIYKKRRKATVKSYAEKKTVLFNRNWLKIWLSGEIDLLIGRPMRCRDNSHQSQYHVNLYQLLVISGCLLHEIARNSIITSKFISL